MKQFLELVVRQLVGPNTVILKEEATVSGRSYVVFLSPADVGKVIGKQGHTIQAIRSLLLGAARAGENIRFEVEEHVAL